MLNFPKLGNPGARIASVRKTCHFTVYVIIDDAHPDPLKVLAMHDEDVNFEDSDMEGGEIEVVSTDTTLPSSWDDSILWGDCLDKTGLEVKRILNFQERTGVRYMGPCIYGKKTWRLRKVREDGRVEIEQFDPPIDDPIIVDECEVRQPMDILNR